MARIISGPCCFMDKDQSMNISRIMDSGIVIFSVGTSVMGIKKSPALPTQTIQEYHHQIIPYHETILTFFIDNESAYSM